MQIRILSLLFCLGASLSFAQSPTINPDNITIVRDKWGIPHIFAKTDPEVAYGLAWAQAEDNFEVIQQTFLFAKSLLGREYGKAGAAGDFFSHLARTDELVEEKMETDISPEFKSYLEGFCEGMNAYAAAHPKEVINKLAFPVTPQEVLMSYPLKIAEFTGMGRTVSGILGGNYYDKLADSVNWEGKGSNSFAVSKRLSKDGKTYLICNPHVAISGAEAFYEAHLISEEGMNFHGAMFPGSVSPQIGTNPNLGWTHTNNYYDHTDVFLLKMHPTEELKYEFDGKWETLEKEDTKLTVKLKGIPFPLKVKRATYWSKYGPVVESQGGKFFAVRIPQIFAIKAPEQWYRMNKASNFQEFQEALKWDGLPYFNITYADKDDNIMYLFNGHFPKRNPGYDWGNVIPGNTSKTLWTSYIPLDERPKILNPDCGYVYNANHNPFKCTCEESWLDAEDYDPLVGYNTVIDDLPRSRRWREAYTDGTQLSMEELKKLKYDVTLPVEDPYTKTFRQAGNLDESKYPDLAYLIKELREWDLEASPEQIGPTIAYLFYVGINKKRFNWEKEGGKASEERLVEALNFAKNHLIEHFGFTNVKMEDFFRFRRGGKELPIYGYQGTLAARWGGLSNSNGKFYARGGDNFMMFIQYDENGVNTLESIVPFGSSNNPESPHYDDQMELYAQKGMKKLTFDRDEIFANAERKYSPK
ncbi:MAG: penicillin acylase family protein [Bacteroidota bacterium]